MYLEEIDLVSNVGEQSTSEVIVLEQECLLNSSNSIINNFVVFSNKDIEKDHKYLEEYHDEDLED